MQARWSRSTRRQSPRRSSRRFTIRKNTGDTPKTPRHVAKPTTGNASWASTIRASPRASPGYEKQRLPDAMSGEKQPRLGRVRDRRMTHDSADRRDFALHGPRARAKRAALRLLARAMTRVPRWWIRPCRPETWRRILVYQGGGLGDLLRVFPVLETLREELPLAHITLVAELAAPFETLFPTTDLVDAGLRIDLARAQATPFGQ